MCPAIFFFVFLSFSLHSFSRASRHLPSLLLSPRAQSSQPLSPLTPCSVLSVLMFSMIRMFVFLSIHDTLSTLLHAQQCLYPSVQVSAPYIEQSGTPNVHYYSSTFVSSLTPLSFHISVNYSPPIAYFPIYYLYSASHCLLA